MPPVRPNLTRLTAPRAPLSLPAQLRANKPDFSAAPGSLPSLSSAPQAPLSLPAQNKANKPDPSSAHGNLPSASAAPRTPLSFPTQLKTKPVSPSASGSLRPSSTPAAIAADLVSKRGPSSDSRSEICETCKCHRVGDKTNDASTTGPSSKFPAGAEKEVPRHSEPTATEENAIPSSQGPVPPVSRSNSAPAPAFSADELRSMEEKLFWHEFVIPYIRELGYRGSCAFPTRDPRKYPRIRLSPSTSQSADNSAYAPASAGYSADAIKDMQNRLYWYGVGENYSKKSSPTPPKSRPPPVVTPAHPSVAESQAKRSGTAANPESTVKVERRGEKKQPVGLAGEASSMEEKGSERQSPRDQGKGSGRTRSLPKSSGTMEGVFPVAAQTLDVGATKKIKATKEIAKEKESLKKKNSSTDINPRYPSTAAVTAATNLPMRKEEDKGKTVTLVEEGRLRSREFVTKKNQGKEKENVPEKKTSSAAADTAARPAPPDSPNGVNSAPAPALSADELKSMEEKLFWHEFVIPHIRDLGYMGSRAFPTRDPRKYPRSRLSPSAPAPSPQSADNSASAPAITWYSANTIQEMKSCLYWYEVVFPVFAWEGHQGENYFKEPSRSPPKSRQAPVAAAVHPSIATSQMKPSGTAANPESTVKVERREKEKQPVGLVEDKGSERPSPRTQGSLGSLSKSSETMKGVFPVAVETLDVGATKKNQATKEIAKVEKKTSYTDINPRYPSTAAVTAATDLPVGKEEDKKKTAALIEAGRLHPRKFVTKKNQGKEKREKENVEDNRITQVPSKDINPPYPSTAAVTAATDLPLGKDEDKKKAAALIEAGGLHPAELREIHRDSAGDDESLERTTSDENVSQDISFGDIDPRLPSTNASSLEAGDPHPEEFEDVHELRALGESIGPGRARSTGATKVVNRTSSFVVSPGREKVSSPLNPVGAARSVPSMQWSSETVGDRGRKNSMVDPKGMKGLPKMPRLTVTSPTPAKKTSKRVPSPEVTTHLLHPLTAAFQPAATERGKERNKEWAAGLIETEGLSDDEFDDIYEMWSLRESVGPGGAINGSANIPSGSFSSVDSESQGRGNVLSPEEPADGTESADSAPTSSETVALHARNASRAKAPEDADSKFDIIYNRFMGWLEHKRKEIEEAEEKRKREEQEAAEKAKNEAPAVRVNVWSSFWDKWFAKRKRVEEKREAAAKREEEARRERAKKREQERMLQIERDKKSRQEFNEWLAESNRELKEKKRARMERKRMREEREAAKKIEEEREKEARRQKQEKMKSSLLHGSDDSPSGHAGPDGIVRVVPPNDVHQNDPNDLSESTNLSLLRLNYYMSFGSEFTSSFYLDVDNESVEEAVKKGDEAGKHTMASRRKTFTPPTISTKTLEQEDDSDAVAADDPKPREDGIEDDSISHVISDPFLQDEGTDSELGAMRILQDHLEPIEDSIYESSKLSFARIAAFYNSFYDE